ncbi:hypothetical protein A0J57_00450 [Sphingobium sp. 22B]|uniref:hypothetical protein n=1 Tax=unclassified Sphingobium TaxID=2611147 RepID=UPI0005CC11C3|nr:MULTISPECIES: hypothetical protein [unclassified Sphingobium]KXU33071.1 hypothetical protein AXW74_04120 [Sphingobium sp. AM]KYC33929.1 hypothetical protein A0J57_00450 [Sphingobium sp. 22B]OAP32281.1 hypothetical protein A8O16_08910 [Sphingobium sp. 20006FA]
MPKQRHIIAHSVAQRLFAAEEALDIAAARIAELNAALPLARLECRLAASIGQDAFRSSAAAVVLVARTREEIVATHARLKQASDDIGLGERAYGDVFKVAADGPPATDRHLRAA